MRDDLEWEDIETMLYNQVNHGRAENEESIIATCKHSEAKTPMNTRHMKQKRLFYCRKGHFQFPVLLSFENEGKVGSDNITMQNNLIISPNNPITHGNNFTPYYKNTITVNQYTTIPFIVNSDQHGTHIPRPNNQSCVSLSTKKNKSLKKRRKQMIARRNRGKRREKINGNPQSNFSFSSLLVEASVKGTFQRNANEVICVSDESSTECIILHDMEPLAPSLNKNVSTDFSDNYNRCNGDINKLGIDEDIIFVPRPSSRSYKYRCGGT
ncbi:hypothetical protein NQ317_019270 [Molorchus minor]|uniref:Uncharacterized protein n=1 Tax=Molorchus minor TaxID=1323400 RepID=A0ABQ9JVZ5_9CUCU|nr:hypothetical protein NQ317_019270 [Molorchus minor]